MKNVISSVLLMFAMVAMVVSCSNDQQSAAPEADGKLLQGDDVEFVIVVDEAPGWEKKPLVFTVEAWEEIAAIKKIELIPAACKVLSEDPINGDKPLILDPMKGGIEVTSKNCAAWEVKKIRITSAKGITEELVNP